jgi:hypothetical protein
MSSEPLAKDVELMAAKLTKSNRRATPLTDFSTPLSSLISDSIELGTCDAVQG